LTAVVAAASFVLCVIPLVGVLSLIGIVVACVVIQTAGALWLLAIAFQEDAFQGLLFLFLPFYAFYYLVTRWGECRPPFMLCIVSLVSLLAGIPGFLVGTIAFGALFG